MQVFVKIEDETCKLLDGESVLMNYPLHLLKDTKAHKGIKNKKKTKKTTTSQDFLVKGGSIEGHVTKVIERIIMNVSLLILHKTKVLVL